METPVRIDSRFPNMGTTIFTVMSRLARARGKLADGLGRSAGDAP